MTKDEYLQKFQTTFTQKDGLIGNDVRALTLDKSGNLWVGTEVGISRFDGKNWMNDDTITKISAIYSDRNGKIWTAAQRAIFSYSDDAWKKVTEFSEVDENIHSIVKDETDDIWVATESRVGCFDGKDWQSTEVKDALIRDIAVDDNGKSWIATDSGLHWSEKSKNSFALQNVFEAEKYGLLSNDVRCVVIDASGHLWIGTSVGINIFDGRSQPSLIETRSAMGIRPVKGWHSITGENGLPYEDVRVIAIASREKSQQVWIGTTIGAACLQNGTWEYYASKRWLPDDKVSAIAIQNDSIVWIGTPHGISKIEKRPYTLEKKATFFEQRIQDRHNRYGYVTSVSLENPGDLSSAVHNASDNDGLWTALYIAAESFRYAVTGEVEAKKLAEKSMRALMRLEEITPVDGFPARAIIRKGEEVNKSHGEWHDTPDGQWEWKGDTSSDEIDGHLFAYSVYYDLVADEKEKQEIAGIVGRIMTYIVDNDFLLIDVDGERTRWGVWSPRLLNTTWIDQQGLNSLEILAHLKTAYHITDNEKFQEAYLYLINEHHYALNTIEQKILPPGEVNHSDDELAFISYYPLLKYEDDPSLRSIYLLSLERSWQIAHPEKCPLWNFIYGALTENYCDVENSRDTLRRIPMELIDWTMKNTHRADLEIDQQADRSDRPQSLEVLPPDERVVMKWNGNPYRLDAGRGGRSEDDGTFFLLPYWMGCYYSEDMPLLWQATV